MLTVLDAFYQYLHTRTYLQGKHLHQLRSAEGNFIAVANPDNCREEERHTKDSYICLLYNYMTYIEILLKAAPFKRPTYSTD